MRSMRQPRSGVLERCGACGITWQLTTTECARCSLDRKLRGILTAADGTLAPELNLLRDTLVQVNRPDHALDWLNKTGVRDTLRAVAAHHTISHETLDALPPNGTVEHLRSMLVAAGALAPRDQRLTALERWIDQAVNDRKSFEHQRVLREYAVWHHLRRLRGRLDGQPAGTLQVRNVRRHVTATAAFLDWLDSQELSLATCTQGDLDQWFASEPSRADHTASFVRWAVAHRRASRLAARATRWNGPTEALDQDRRWADARRLLHDGTYPVADRVAGLLILLYAQKLSAITGLTTQHIRHEEDQTFLFLGTRPIVLPPPMDDLVGTLMARRKPPGSVLVNITSDWLFPGRWPGQPLTEDSLARRLRTLGIRPSQSRKTALFALATEIPAAILAKTLGIHIKCAIQWQQLSSGDWAAYAAEVGQRNA
ncbi:hypothetical protein ABIA39_009029, partial [Nocardia sp. GAS34]